MNLRKIYSWLQLWCTSETHRQFPKGEWKITTLLILPRAQPKPALGPEAGLWYCGLQMCRGCCGPSVRDPHTSLYASGDTIPFSFHGIMTRPGGAALTQSGWGSAKRTGRQKFHLHFLQVWAVWLGRSYFTSESAAFAGWLCQSNENGDGKLEGRHWDAFVHSNMC